MKHKKHVIILISLVVLMMSSASLIYFKISNKNKVKTEASNNAESEPKVTESSENLNVVTPEPAKTENTKPAEVETPPAKQTWPVTYSTDEAGSLTVVVNKKHKLPSDYAPSLKQVSGGQLRTEAADALANLLDSAKNDGVPMQILSSYRSYSTQVSTYNHWVSVEGKAQADRSSARAGHSEHQLGLAVDLGMPDNSCNLLICFGDTAQGKWLVLHAVEFGFIIRYESTTESITGYQYEPWHLRYLGLDVAKAVNDSGKTLDQYYGVEGGDY